MVILFRVKKENRFSDMGMVIKGSVPPNDTEHKAVNGSGSPRKVVKRFFEPVWR